MKRVLIVEDDERWQDNIVELLEEENYATVLASTLPDAINALDDEKNPVDIAVVDINLTNLVGNKDGEKFVGYVREKRLQSNGRHIPIIILSGTIPAATISLDGVFCFFEKDDLDLDEFLDKVAQAISSG